MPSIPTPATLMISVLLSFFCLCHASEISDLSDEHGLSAFNEQSDLNVKQFVRSICYLNPHNSYMRVSRQELLDGAMVDPQLDKHRMLSQFGDGLGTYLWKRDRNLTGGRSLMIMTVYSILDAVIALRKNPPVDCPISSKKLDELLEQLLILELSAASASMPGYQHFSNKIIIEGMRVGQRRFLSAVAFLHGWVVEVRKETRNQFLVTYLNSARTSRPIHRTAHGKVEYFARHQLSLEQISNLDYFANYRREVFDLYPRSKRIDEQLFPNDLYGCQKMGTCHAKAVQLALKWFFRELDPSNGIYNWWKVWHFNYRIPKIKELLGESSAMARIGNQYAPTASVVITHHVNRLRKVSQQMGSKSCLQTLDAIAANEKCYCPSIRPANIFVRLWDYIYPTDWEERIHYTLIFALICCFVMMTMTSGAGKRFN